MYQSIKDNGYAETVPFVGLFSAGAFTNKLFAASKSGRIEEYSSNAVMYAISTNFLAVILLFRLHWHTKGSRFFVRFVD